MVKDGRGVSIGLVAVVAVVASALSWAGLRIWVDAGNALPDVSWGGAVLLVFMAVGIYFAGLPVRRFVRGQARRALSPIRAMRTLVLAQAAALGGAAVFGWYLGHVLVLLPDLDVDTARASAVRALVLCAASLLLVIAGLLVQRMCRLDDKGPKGGPNAEGDRTADQDRQAGAERGRGHEDDERDLT